MGKGHWSLLRRDPLAHHRDCVVESRTHRADRDVEGFGDFGIGELLGEAQFEDFAMEGREGLDHFAGRADPFVRHGGGDQIGGRLNSMVTLMVPPFPGRETEVPGHSEKIGPQGMGLFAARYSTRHFEEGLLNQILGRLRTVAMTPREVAGQVFRRLPEQLFEIRLFLYGFQGDGGSGALRFPVKKGSSFTDVPEMSRKVHRNSKFFPVSRRSFYRISGKDSIPEAAPKYSCNCGET